MNDKRLQRIGDHAGETRRIEQTFLEIELPAAALLRHQAALQLVGEPRHGAREVLELLVEQRAELVQFFGRAELGRLDDLVEFLGEDLVVELVRELLGVGARRRQRRFVAGLARLVLVALGEVLVGAFGLAGLVAVAGRLILFGLGVLALAFALLGRLVVVLAVLGILVVALFFAVAVAVVELALWNEVQIAQQMLGSAGEQVLVLELLQQRGQRNARLLLDLFLPQVDKRVA